MLNQFAAKHRIEVAIRIGIDVMLGIEEIDFAGEVFAAGRSHFARIRLARRAKVTPPDLAITQLEMQRRRNLHVSAHL